MRALISSGVMKLMDKPMASSSNTFSCFNTNLIFSIRDSLFFAGPSNGLLINSCNKLGVLMYLMIFDLLLNSFRASEVVSWVVYEKA